MARTTLVDGLWAFTHEGDTEEQMWERCRDGLKESVRYAREFGVTLALQNHPPMVKQDYKDILRMVHEVDSPNLKVVLDALLLHQYDEAYIREAASEVGALQAMSHFGGDFDRTPDGKFTVTCERSGRDNTSADVRPCYVGHRLPWLY